MIKDFNNTQAHGIKRKRECLSVTRFKDNKCHRCGRELRASRNLFGSEYEKCSCHALREQDLNGEEVKLPARVLLQLLNKVDPKTDVELLDRNTPDRPDAVELARRALLKGRVFCKCKQCGDVIPKTGAYEGVRTIDVWRRYGISMTDVVKIKLNSKVREVPTFCSIACDAIFASGEDKRLLAEYGIKKERKDAKKKGSGKASKMKLLVKALQNPEEFGEDVQALVKELMG